MRGSLSNANKSPQTAVKGTSAPISFIIPIGCQVTILDLPSLSSPVTLVIGVITESESPQWGHNFTPFYPNVHFKVIVKAERFLS